MDFEDKVQDILSRTEIMEDTFHQNGLEILSYNVDEVSNNSVTYIFELASYVPGLSSDVRIHMNFYNSQQRILHHSADEVIYQENFSGYCVVQCCGYQEDLLKRMDHVRIYCTKDLQGYDCAEITFLLQQKGKDDEF